MNHIESAWGRFPGYAIDLEPWPGRARVRLGDTLVADSAAAVVVKESDHADQLYFPVDDVDWAFFTETDHHTICPFKGEADYWSLTVGDQTEENVLWTYRAPFPEVAGLAGHVAFYTHRVEIDLSEEWPSGDEVVHRFPRWGDVRDLTRLLDVTPAEEGGFTSPSFPDPPLGTFLDIPEDRRPRQVIEGGHLLGQAIVAASRSVPDQRVVTASMIFNRAARFDAPVDVDVDVVRQGRTYSTVETRTSQSAKLCTIGLVLLDSGADDTIRGTAAMPDLAGPGECPPLDHGVTGREVRIVDGAYTMDPDDVGPAEIHAWVRVRDVPDDPVLHAALLAQPTTHWTIAASMRPHPGVSEALAHVSLSTGPMAVDIAFHDEADVTDWLLYSNPSIYAGKGHVQGQGRVFTQDGRIVASYSVHAMVRAFAGDPGKVGGYTSAM